MQIFLKNYLVLRLDLVYCFNLFAFIWLHNMHIELAKRPAFPKLTFYIFIHPCIHFHQMRFRKSWRCYTANTLRIDELNNQPPKARKRENEIFKEI